VLYSIFYFMIVEVGTIYRNKGKSNDYWRVFQFHWPIKYSHKMLNILQMFMFLLVSREYDNSNLQEDSHTILSLSFNCDVISNKKRNVGYR